MRIKWEEKRESFAVNLAIVCVAGGIYRVDLLVLFRLLRREQNREESNWAAARFAPPKKVEFQTR